MKKDLSSEICQRQLPTRLKERQLLGKNLAKLHEKSNKKVLKSLAAGLERSPFTD